LRDFHTAWAISRHFGKTALCLLSPTADIGGAIPITEYHHVSHRRRTGGLIMFGTESWGYGGYGQFHMVVWIILAIAAVAGIAWRLRSGL
jgi:hypothetical protein